MSLSTRVRSTSHIINNTKTAKKLLRGNLGVTDDLNHTIGRSIIGEEGAPVGGDGGCAVLQHRRGKG
jgi:hypothetical protein